MLQSYTINITDVFFIVSLFSLTLGINEVAIFFVLYYLVSHLNVLKVNKNIIYFFSLVLFSGISMTVVSLFIYDISYISIEGILLRNRFFIIRVLYAIVIAVYMHGLKKDKILYLVYIIAMVNLIVGLGQIGLNIYNQEFVRIKMVSLEPSEAAMFYSFASPLLLLYLKINKEVYFKVWCFIGIGLFILSKALFIVLGFWLVIYAMRSKKKIFIVPFLLIIAFLIYPYLFKLHQIQSMHHLIQVYLVEGIYGLNPEYQIWTSFSLRISSILTSIKIFFDNIFGIGFGVFHPLYINYMSTTKLGVISGYEIQNILNNDMYATPKSSFLELTVSCGIFFIIPFVKMGYNFLAQNLDFLIKMSFASLVLMALMVELAPFLTYLSILFVLQNKHIIKD